MVMHAKTGVSMLLLTVVLQSYSQIIYVGGIMNESQTWTSDFTYVVTQDLVVPNNVKLIIEAGVVVKINYNRGIIIENGILRISGTQTDSVYFIPNHSNPGQNWKWRGLIIKNADAEEEIFLRYTKFVEAETAIKIEDSYDVSIENASILNCQNLGVHFVNSSACFIVNSNIENNYDGVEIIAGYLESSSYNVIYNCIIKNQNHNIYIFGEDGGLTHNNLIGGNLIGSGNNGIWIINKSELINSGNIIEHNLILNNGEGAGYGLFLAHDSTIITNNIFWRNNIAIFSEQNGDNCSIINNSFYQNTWAIAIGAGSEGNKHLNNTFSLNSTELLGIKETRQVVFSNNNMLHNYGMENIVVNNTAFHLSIADNFWGTTDTAQINNLIYDSLNNPDLGELNYIPYLNSIDTSNPVAPPYHTIKQIVNNKVRISWHANQEQDLMGYRIYYGNYSNYSFSDKYETGTDTSFAFAGNITIYDTVAVTAFDSALTYNNSQVSGHESPFAFAAIYPYAGNDTIICEHLAELKIVNGNIPMEYQNLFWFTNGDGYFNDPFILTPTYFPGLQDIQKGGAIISLNVVTADNTLVDSFNISIIDDPVAFAGNDTIVIVDAEITLIEATAHNYDYIMWFTSGDGSFNNDTLVNPIYYPGYADIESGIVFLEMRAYSVCGAASDSLKITIEPYFSVEGKLWAFQKAANPGVVIAYMDNAEGARAVQIESAESDGTFRFEKLMTGNYYLYALPDTNNSDNVVPGYYANKLRWQSSYLLPVDADVYDVDIQLPSVDFILPHGEASISGHMIMPDYSKFNSEIYCMPWFDNSNNVFCQGGLSNVTVLLFNHTKSRLLDYTLTDELGNFYFNRLPYGNYIVDAEKAGFLSIPSPVISLSPEHKNETGVILEINHQKIGISLNRNSSNENHISVYPNPAYNVINIPYSNPLFLSSQIEIYDLCGNCVMKYIIPAENISSMFKLDIANLSSGLYFGQIVNTNRTFRFRFIKK